MIIMSDNVVIKLVSGGNCIELLYTSAWKCLHTDIFLFNFLFCKLVYSQQRTWNMVFRVAVEHWLKWSVNQNLLGLKIYKISHILHVRVQGGPQ